MKTSIPMLELDAQTAELWPELEKTVLDVMRSGRFILGPNVEAFEREAAEYIGVRHAIGVSSGADALVLSLRALGIGPGDEVIAPSFTFFATVEAISLVGATPVFADIDAVTFCMAPASVEAVITPRTRALLPVHLFGHAADMTALSEIAQRHDLKILEDAAQSFGGRQGGDKTGSLGDVGAFSFFPSKNLGAFGDGGLVTTDDDAVADRVRLLRGHGSRQRYVHEDIGYTARLDEIQAAVLRVKLPHLDRWNQARQRIAARYAEGLADVANVETPREIAPVYHVFHQYTLRVGGGRRDALLQGLADAGVGSVIYYPTPVHGFDMYEAGTPLPETDRAAAEVLSLPIWPEMGDEQVDVVIDAVRRCA